jgi:hypothetical protein
MSILTPSPTNPAPADGQRTRVVTHAVVSAYINEMAQSGARRTVEHPGPRRVTRRRQAERRPCARRPEPVM